MGLMWIPKVFTEVGWSVFTWFEKAISRVPHKCFLGMNWETWENWVKNFALVWIYPPKGWRRCSDWPLLLFPGKCQVQLTAAQRGTAREQQDLPQGKWCINSVRVRMLGVRMLILLAFQLLMEIFTLSIFYRRRYRYTDWSHMIERWEEKTYAGWREEEGDMRQKRKREGKVDGQHKEEFEKGIVKGCVCLVQVVKSCQTHPPHRWRMIR